MNRSLLHRALALTALVSSAAASLPALAYDGHAIYRAQVLGERIAAPAPTPAIAGSTQTLVTGSHARYLVHLGRSPEQAIAEASRAGDDLSSVVVVARKRSVDAFEAYERHMGRLPRLPDAPSATGLAQHAAPILR
jgi:hypothetical protein